MIIRPARLEDASDICAIWNAIIEDTAATFTTELKTPDGIATDIRTRGGGFQVAEEGADILGFATYFPFRGGPGYAYTKELSVHLAASARGKGVGRQLVQVLETHARAENVHSLWAGVSGDNPDGAAFHERLGYTQVARLPEVGYKFGRWMDLILLQKRL